MWKQVETVLSALLSAKIYDNLLSDPVYRSFLTSAGLGPNFPKGALLPAVQKRLQDAAQVRARIAVRTLEQAGGLEPASTTAKLLAGPITLYRFWESRSAAYRTGVWWFESALIDQAKRDAKGVDARAVWLREKLAVCVDWSAMDRIDRLDLAPGVELPAVQGLGKPQRMYSMNAIPSGRVQGADYWPNLGKQLPGGLRQTVLPFIPAVQGQDLRSFLNRG